MSIRRKVLEYAYITLGSFLTGVGFTYLINPAKIASGGVSGIGTILFHTVGWNPGYVIFALSLPLFFVGMLVFGRRFGFKSLVGTVLLSFFTTILVDISGGNGFLDYNDSVSMLLSALFGGVAVGAGIGFVMKAGANTGGTDIIAQILNKYTSLSLGTALTIVDGMVIVASAFIFGLEHAMYAIITVYVCGITIDRVVMPIGANTAKTVMIISEKIDEMKPMILDELDHGATVLSGTGMYTGYERPVIMTVVANNELERLTSRVKDIDDKAFIIIHDAHQVLGEGFVPISKVMNMTLGE